MSKKHVKVKPGKTQSKLGFAVGLVFVLIGCVIVIPTFGPFGILWTVIAGIITFSNYKNGFTEDGFATHEIEIDETTETTDAIESKLETLENLYQKRLITREEYEEKRKEILAEL